MLRTWSPGPYPTLMAVRVPEEVKELDRARYLELLARRWVVMVNRERDPRNAAVDAIKQMLEHGSLGIEDHWLPFPTNLTAWREEYPYRNRDWKEETAKMIVQDNQRLDEILDLEGLELWDQPQKVPAHDPDAEAIIRETDLPQWTEATFY